MIVKSLGNFVLSKVMDSVQRYETDHEITGLQGGLEAAGERGEVIPGDAPVPDLHLVAGQGGQQAGLVAVPAHSGQWSPATLCWPHPAPPDVPRPQVLARLLDLVTRAEHRHHGPPGHHHLAHSRYREGWQHAKCQ